MAGINGFGANNFGNYGNNINKAGQKAQNLKQQGVAGNQAGTRQGVGLRKAVRTLGGCHCPCRNGD